MKKMKKTIIGATATAFVIGMAFVPNVFAADHSNITSEQGLSDCISDASSGDVTCTLGDDITLSAFQEINATGKNITIDLGTYSITRALGSTFSLENGNVTIKGNGGKIISKNGNGNGNFYVFGSGGSHLTIEKGVTLSGDNPLVISNNGDNSGIEVNIYGDIINDIHPEGSLVDSSAIAVHGSVKTGNPVINVYGNVKSDFSAGIYQAGDSTINLKPGSSVTGSSGVVIKSGTLNVNGASVIAKGAYNDDVTSSGDGFTSTGAAIQIDSNSTYSGKINVNINENSTITSENGDVIQAYGVDPNNFKTISINGNAMLQAAKGKKVLNVDENVVSPYELNIDGEKVEPGTLANVSNYGVPEPTTTVTGTGSNTTENTKNPKTGDNVGLYFILAILGLVGTGLASKKVFSK